MKFKELAENLTFIRNAQKRAKNENKDKVSVQLGEKNPPEDMPDHVYNGLVDYTDHDEHSFHNRSLDVNGPLIRGEEVPEKFRHIHNAIHAAAKPLGRDLDVYSGTKHDFGEMAKQSHRAILHSPAHISATHDVGTALSFAQDGGYERSGKPLHILHVKLSSEDKVVHVSHISHKPDENETVIPSGAKLKYIGTNVHQEAGKRPIHEHSFYIHSQE